MIRYLTLLASCFLLPSTRSALSSRLNLSDDRYATLLWCMKCILALGGVNEVNSLLNTLAENRWQWKSDKSNWNWKSEVAVVTGGSRGIGACVVKKLVSHGVKVAVLDVEPLSNDFSQDELPSIRHYQCDITSQDAIHRAAEAIRSDLGSPSILVNNAGIGNAYTILDIPTATLRKLFDINLLSQWSTVQEFLPDMIAKKKGHIMSVASLASFVSLAGAVDYSCTKAALLAFHEGLTQELKHRYKCPQIKTSIVHPGWTRTAITSHPTMEAGLKSVGAGLMRPEDVADAMVRQIVAAKSGQLVLGPGLAPKIRALPLWIQELVRDGQSNIVTGNMTTASG